MKIIFKHDNPFYDETPNKAQRKRSIHHPCSIALEVPDTVDEWDNLSNQIKASLDGYAGCNWIELNCGIAKVHPEDMFDRKIGCKVAIENMVKTKFRIRELTFIGTEGSPVVYLTGEKCMVSIRRNSDDKISSEILHVFGGCGCDRH